MCARAPMWDRAHVIGATRPRVNVLCKVRSASPCGEASLLTSPARGSRSAPRILRVCGRLGVPDSFVQREGQCCLDSPPAAAAA